MTYKTENIEGVEVEEYVIGRILRLKHNSTNFKCFVQSDGPNSVSIYIGHGDLTPNLIKALKLWAKSLNIEIVRWGRTSDTTTEYKKF